MLLGIHLSIFDFKWFSWNRLNILNLQFLILEFSRLIITITTETFNLYYHQHYYSCRDLLTDINILKKSQGQDRSLWDISQDFIKIAKSLLFFSCTFHYLSYRCYVLIVVTHDQCSQWFWKNLLEQLLHEDFYQWPSAIFNHRR